MTHGWLRVKVTPCQRPPTGNTNAKPTGGQSDPRLKTADKLAKRHGVGPATIKRDGKFAEGIEKLKTVAPDIERRIAVTRHGERAA